MKSLNEYTQERSNKIMITLNTIILFFAVLQIAQSFDAQITKFVKLYFGNDGFISTNSITILTALSLSGIYVLAFNEYRKIKIFLKKLKNSIS